jgi:hypothetical protein
MSAWSTSPFYSEAANDWLLRFEFEGLSELRSRLSRVANARADESLDPGDASAAIAAAEVIAAAVTPGGRRLPITVESWLRSHAECGTKTDRTLACRAVRRVLCGSELDPGWSDAQGDSWRTNVRSLEARLQGEEDSTVGAPVPPLSTVDDRDKEVLLTFLRARGLEPSAGERARIEWARDPREMRRWLERALTVGSVASVLGD